jgi:hypothetical protein
MNDNSSEATAHGSTSSSADEITRRTSTRVVQSVSRATGTPPEELPVLYDAVDPDALDAMFPHDGPANGDLVFSYAGMIVECLENGEIRVSPADDQ